MGKSAAQPVVIFLPVREDTPLEDNICVDPVCGKALWEPASAGRLRHNGRHHHFCSLECAERFAADPEEFSR